MGVANKIMEECQVAKSRAEAIGLFELTHTSLRLADKICRLQAQKKS